MRTADRLLAVLGTVVVAGALVVAAAEAGPRGARRSPRAGPAAPPGGPLAGALGQGVSIDPDTLQLVGLDLQPEDGSTVVSWSTLETYEYQEDLVGVPDALRALDGTKVTMAGFMLPLYEFENIREFNLVASHWSCCFGVPPGINGWLQIGLSKSQPGLENSTEPIKITGTFRIAEQKEAGYVVAIYAIEDAKATVLGW